MSTTTDNVTHATADAFDQVVLGSDLPVLVDFWAPWCPPCQALKPVVERLAGELAGRARVVLVDVEAEPQLAERFGIGSIPALRVFEDGKVVAAATGYRSREELLSLLHPFVSAPDE